MAGQAKTGQISSGGAHEVDSAQKQSPKPLETQYLQTVLALN